MQAIPFGKWCMIGLVLLLLGEQQGQAEDLVSKARVVPAHQAERHLKNIRQLTVGRELGGGSDDIPGQLLLA
ncbi:MAG: hypothetical protein CAF43_012355 [Nitrospira sp. CG24C]|nr:MAG: hypothetical protein CAF43_012355 [Nitrospira sp. CG24C]